MAMIDYTNLYIIIISIIYWSGFFLTYTILTPKNDTWKSCGISALLSIIWFVTLPLYVCLKLLFLFPIKNIFKDNTEYSKIILINWAKEIVDNKKLRKQAKNDKWLQGYIAAMEDLIDDINKGYIK